MTVSMAITADGVEETVRELRKLDQALVRAFAGGIKAGAVETARAIEDGIWVDTGALRDSIYVEDPDMRRNAVSSVVGVAAPYAAIVEETHPRRPNHIKARAVEASGRTPEVIARTTDALSRVGGGPENIGHPFRTRPGFNYGTKKRRVRGGYKPGAEGRRRR